MLLKYMKRVLSIFFFSCLISLPAFPQKAAIKVIKTGIRSDASWQILDEKYIPVFNEKDYFRTDTADFTLEADKRFFFEISVSEICSDDTSLFTLDINGEPVILIRPSCGTGDHFFPFHTGVKSDSLAKITGGSDADISDFPWQIYLEADNFTCGGSLIASDWVITAAHCTKDDNGNTLGASLFDVIAGANNPRSGTQGKKYYVSQVIVNENFNSQTLENDIALLKLAVPVDYPNAKPVKLVSAIDAGFGVTDPGVMSWVTGYGLTKVRPLTYPTTLQKVQLPIISNAQALTVWKDIPASDLMAGYMNGNKDACSGDSGGPLVVPVAGDYKLAGIVSWGSNNCNTYGAYTRVSDFESWITSKTGIEISFTAPFPKGDSIVCLGIEGSAYSAADVPGATGYEWQLTNESSGVLTSSANHTVIRWNQGFTGSTYLKLRVLRNTDVSYWSQIKINVVNNTAITSRSKDTTLCAGQSLDLFVRSEGYNLSYSWYKDGDLIRTGKTADLSLPDITVSDSGVYRCNVSGSCGSSESANIGVTVFPVTEINGITSDTEVQLGKSISLEVTAGGHDLSYKWFKDNIQADNGTDAVYTIPAANANHTGLYNVLVNGTCGSLFSKKVYLYVRKQNYVSGPEVFVWPTITNNNINVALSNDQDYNIMLTSIEGNLIKKITDCRYRKEVYLDSCPPGIYIVTVYYSSFRKSVRIVKTG